LNHFITTWRFQAQDDWAGRTCFWLPNVNDITYIQQQIEVPLPPIQDMVGICKRITILIIRQVAFRLEAPLTLAAAESSVRTASRSSRAEIDYGGCWDLACVTVFVSEAAASKQLSNQ
jgi:hypothetical protein